MKTLFFALFFSCIAFTASSQHYYNDLLVAGEIMKKRELFRQHQVKSIRFYSFDGNNQPIEGFSSEQAISNNFTEINTVTTTSLTGTTQNSTYFNAKGQLIRTVDTADGNKTTVTYTYDAEDRITTITNISTSPGQFNSKEQHRWVYKDGAPASVVKIRNDQDTTYISFVKDEQGNLAEGKSIRKGQAQPTVYYYYDPNNRLTDIVRYNARAKRLLPDYIFEYDANGRLATMLVTTEGTNDYQKWYYTYDDKGLKIKDECFSKTKALIGKIEYKYQF